MHVINHIFMIYLFIVNTHVHADHITGTGFLKKQFPACKSAISAESKADADIKLKEGDKLTFGKYELEVRSTPGHTNGKLDSNLKYRGGFSLS